MTCFDINTNNLSSNRQTLVVPITSYDSRVVVIPVTVDLHVVGVPHLLQWVKAVLTSKSGTGVARSPYIRAASAWTA
jgi:hypothetical protein